MRDKVLECIPVIRSGTLVICPRCNKEIACIVRDMFFGELFSINDFHFFESGYTRNSKSCCKNCNEFWMRESISVFTKYGWLNV